MGLKEVQEELKAQLAEAEKTEEVVEEKQEEKKEEEKQEVVEEKKEEVKEEPKEDPKREENLKKVKTPAEYAEERRTAKAAKLAEELEAARAKIAELEKASKPDDAEPNKAEDPVAWAEWKVKQLEKTIAPKVEQLDRYRQEEETKQRNEALKQQAINEVANYEAVVRQNNPDFDEAKQYYANMLAASIKIVNPRITNDALSRIVTDRMLLRASELFNEGYANPVAAMYEEAKSLGFKPSAKNTEIEEIKPDLAKVAANRARNAGTAAASGRGDRAELTPSVAAGMTNAEFAKLKPSEKEAVFRQLQAM